MDTLTPTPNPNQSQTETGDVDETTSLGLQLLQLKDELNKLIANDEIELTRQEIRSARMALAHAHFALGLTDGELLPPHVMAENLSAGQHYYNASDHQVLIDYPEKCQICGSDHYYAGRKDGDSWYSYQVCDGCGCGYSF